MATETITLQIPEITIVCLRMNNPVIVVVRRRWTISSWHPPDDVF